MSDAFTKIILRSAARKVIRDLRKSPKQSTKALLDLAARFSGGQSQQKLLKMAQKMLTDETSAYHTLLQNIATQVEEERLLTFGMNLCYNGCIVGAKQLRQTEAAEGFHIPWTLHLHLHKEGFSKRRARYHSLIDEGEQLGIFTWMLFSHEAAEECFRLASAHPNSAFILFLDRGDETCAEELNNLMLAVPMDADTAAVCAKLREKGLLYSVYTSYGEEELPRIQSWELFHGMEQLRPALSVFLPKPNCPPSVQALAGKAIRAAREEQAHATLLWELERDHASVGRLLSGDGFRLSIDTEGMLQAGAQTLGSMELPLTQLLRQAKEPLTIPV